MHNEIIDGEKYCTESCYIVLTLIIVNYALINKYLHVIILPCLCSISDPKDKIFITIKACKEAVSCQLIGNIHVISN